MRVRIALIVLAVAGISTAQYTSQTYPDPRVDPLQCRVALPGPVCDPSAVLTDADRQKLIERIAQLTAVTASIRNTAPACAGRPVNLELLVAVIDKVGSVPTGAVNVEQFANQLKSRYNRYQDIGQCDTSVLLVNSRQDRQVFTVAGRDARISKDTLKAAFERNIGHFKVTRKS